MKKTFVALVVFLMLCVAAVSAKSSGLGSLGKNLSALSGNAKPAEGTVPEGGVQKEMGSPNYFKFTREFKSAKI